MAIFKRKSKSAKAAEAQPVEEPKPKPEPFRPRHVRTNSNATGHSQQRGNHSDVHLARSPVYGYHSGEPQSSMSNTPNTPTGRASNPQSRNSSTYFGPPSAPSFDSPILGNPKMAAAARDRGYISPHVPADSGYISGAASSGVQSRAPSEKVMDHIHARDPRGNTESSLDHNIGGSSGEGPASLDSSLLGTTTETSSIKRGPDSVLKSSNGYYTRTDDSSDARFDKMARSNPKQTRFERSNEEETSLPQGVVQPASERNYAEAQPRSPGMHSAGVHEQDLGNHAQTAQSYTSQHHGESSQTPIIERGRYPVEHGSGTAESRMSYDATTAPSAPQSPLIRNERARVSQPLSSTAPAQRPLARRGSIPPLSILDGFKVNKRGKILNEEGEPIGELVHGDIMDCVRQKYQGGVVGHVKTLERISTIQPPSRDPRVQQQTVSQNFGNLQPAQEPLFVPQPSISAAPPARAAPPVFVAPPVPESRGIVEPPQSTAQAQDLSQAEVRVQETPQISSLPPSISPLDFEGKDSKYDPPEEISSVDVIDHSDIFIPGATPYIPEKSPQRSPQLSEAFPARMPEPQRVTPPGRHNRL
nr:hypothetical protein CFP56_07975 [Quercus suber]